MVSSVGVVIPAVGASTRMGTPKQLGNRLLQCTLYTRGITDMSDYQFNDQLTLEAKAEELGKRAMAQGLIPSFTIQYFPDNWVFYIPSQNQSEPLTPEEAYLRLKKLVAK